MRYLTIVVIVMLMLSVEAFAETVLTEADNGKTLRLKPLEEVNVTLSSNPTTGYNWEMVEQVESAAVVVVSKEFKASEDTSARVGAGGIMNFRLRLIKAGRFTLTFIYRRSWEKVHEPERIFRITLEEQ